MLEIHRMAGLLGRLGLALAGLLAGHAVQAQTPASAAPPPIADFFRVPQLLDPVLSPDGKHLAAAIGSPSGRRQLAVINLARLDDSRVVAGFNDADIERYRWVNNDRLVFSVEDTQQADRQMLPGLWAISREGGDLRQLVHTWYDFITTASNVKDRRLPWQWRLHSTLRDGSDDVLVQAPVFNSVWDVTDLQLARLDTKTGRVSNLGTGAPEHVSHWVVDQQGVPAALTTWDKGRYASYLKSPTGWQRWEEGDGYKSRFAVPYWVGPDGRLLALATPPGSDTEALYEVDRSGPKLAAEPTVDLAGYDFRGSPIYDRSAKRVLGWHYENDAQGTAWLDAGMRALQAEIDKLLPATVNRIGCEQCTSVPTVLVSASSDRQPPAYFLYTRATQQLQPVGASRPWIEPRQMGLRDMHRFKARDGLTIPVLVTQPPGRATGPRPAVVLVHGGPWVRGAHWEWESDAQFLASRGYVVIEPEFRGSRGYGETHFRASWKQWGLSMQDDVADATQWAVKQGLVDPKRVCIAGASYGGYATLMGLVRHPDLYQCGFQWVGVTDIELMYSIHWSDFSESYKTYGMPLLVGDREKDAQQIKDTSPLAQAHRIKRPLLMAYGGQDYRVPIKHGTAMRNALAGAGNKDVEWIDYPTEGHGWRELKTQVDFWARVEQFLARHIGPGAAAK